MYINCDKQRHNMTVWVDPPDRNTHTPFFAQGGLDLICFIPTSIQVYAYAGPR